MVHRGRTDRFASFLTRLALKQRPAPNRKDTSKQTGKKSMKHLFLVTALAGGLLAPGALVPESHGGITDNLVVHLAFDQDLTDSSGRGNDGVAVGAPKLVPGKVGTNAVALVSKKDGSVLNYVTLGTRPDLNFGTETDFTISFWARFNQWTFDPLLISNKDWTSGAYQGYAIATGTDGRLQWNYSGAPGGRKDYDGPANTISDGNWHHILISFLRAGLVTTYLDGNEVDSRDVSFSLNNVDTPAGQATNLGQDGTAHYTDGGTAGVDDLLMDDLGIWRRALTATEAKAIFDAGAQGKDLTTVVSQPELPTIRTRPLEQTVLAGNAVSLKVLPAGSSPFTYIWRRDTVQLTNATGAILTLENVQDSDAGSYTVEITNAVGRVTSDPVSVNVDSSQAPELTESPVPAAAPVGGAVSFSSKARGVTPLTYQWFKDGATISGATNATLTLNRTVAADAGSYTVQVTAGNKLSTTSSAAALTLVSDIKQGLVVHLTFDNDYSDASGHHNDGTPVGSPSLVDGRIGGKALRFSQKADGTAFNYVTLGTPADLDFAQNIDFTISLWVKFSQWTRDPVLIANKDWNLQGTKVGWALATGADGRFQWNLKEQVGERADFDSGPNLISDGQWHHVAVSYQRGGSATTFVDGAQVNSQKLPGSGTVVEPGYPVNIGQDGTGSYTDNNTVSISDGTIDDVAIWRRAVTPEEIASIYHKGAVLGANVEETAVTDALLVYLPFDNSLEDKSGQGHNASAVGTPGFVPGKLGTHALSFTSDKSGNSFNYVTLGHPTALDFGKDADFSVSFWTRFTNWTGDPAFIGNKDWTSGGNQGWVIATAGNGRLQWNLGDGDAGGRTRNDYDGAAGTLSDGQWHHVLVTFKRKGDAITYLDGTDVNHTAVTADLDSIDAAAGLAINIGQDGKGTYTDNNAVGISDGQIDDVAIWARVIAPDEVKTIFAHGAAGTSLLPASQSTSRYGLVGVGRIPADSFDARGPGLDTLGGVGSSMFVDPRSLARSGDAASGYTYHGTLYALPDRGFGDGTQNFLPRIEKFDLTVAPYYGAEPAGQSQVILSNTATLLLTVNGTNYTGFDADASTQTNYPQSTAHSLGQGHRSLDGEGLVRLADGSYFISDEYGPFVYKFDANGSLEYMLQPPAAILPKRGAYPGTNYFSATNVPTSGRRNNRGLEGLSITPDGQRLVAMLQSPTIQDAGAGNSGRNTRLLMFDIDTNSPSFTKPVAEYVYQLTLNGSAQTNRNTPVSEVLALNRQQFLVLERDSGLGFGTGTNLMSTYKRIVLASTEGASNIINSGYDLEPGAPGQISLPAGNLPSDVAPLKRTDLVDILDPAQLAKFGLNNSTNQNTNTLSEKWEGLALIPLNEPEAPDDFLLLVMNDNDFKAPIVYHNGVPVGTNDPPVDTMVLAYRVALPNYNAPVPANALPGVILAGPTNSVLSSPLTLTLTARAVDPDGLVTNVVFWSGSNQLSQSATYPFQITFTNPPAGDLSVYAVVYDNQGASATSAVYNTSIVLSQQPPIVALAQPTNGTSVLAPVNLVVRANASDVDGWVSRVEFQRDGVKVGTVTNSPFALTLTNHSLGSFGYTAVATDNQGLVSTSAVSVVTIGRAVNAGAFTLQILHGSDFEAGIPALQDAPRFSSVLTALKSEYPTNTVVLAAGDDWIVGPFFYASSDPAAPYVGKGRGDVMILNALGVQASAVGNHEFDDTPATFRDLLRASGTYPGTAFPFLSANLDFSKDSSTSGLIAADAQDYRQVTNKVAKSCLINVGGQTIGVVGATTADFRAITSAGSIGVETNIAAAVQGAVDQLLARGINKIVLVTQLQQIANEFALAEQLHDVDVIIAGGSDTILSKETDRLRTGDERQGDYPEVFTSKSGEPVHVVSTDGNYRYVGRLVLTFDNQGIISSVSTNSGAFATDEQGVTATGNLPPIPAVLAITTNLQQIIVAKDGNMFGTTLVYLNGLRSSVRTEEANLGNLSADANLWYAQQFDANASLSLKNGGGIRDSIGAISSSGVRVPPPANPLVSKETGDVSQLDIENALRFNNALSLITITAQELRDAAEWGVAAVAPGATPGQFPQIGGFWFSYNPTNAPMTYTRDSNNIPTAITQTGARVQSLVATRADGSLDLVVENGSLVGDPNRTFRMVTLDFLASGGDNYFPLTLGSNRLDLATSTNRVFSTVGGEQWALATYLTNIQVYADADLPPSADRRIQSLALRQDTVTWPLLTQITPGAGTTVYFTTLPDKHYQVWAAEAIGGPWTNQTTTPLAGTGRLVSYTDTTALTSKRFYQLRRTD